MMGSIKDMLMTIEEDLANKEYHCSFGKLNTTQQTEIAEKATWVLQDRMAGVTDRIKKEATKYNLFNGV